MDTTVAKGMSVLELLARADGPLRLSTIADQLGLQKSNVHRLLGTLAELGYVTKEADTNRYALTLRLWELGAAVQAMHPAKRAATPYLQELHKTTGETVSLTVLDGDDVLYLDKIQSPRLLRFTTRPGSRTSAVFTAAGRAILAYEPDPQQIVERAVTQRPTFDVASIMQDLEGIRQRGYAVSESTWTPGLIAVAAPITGRNGRAAAALSVSAPAERLGETRMAEITEAVLNTSARIAEGVGRI